MQNENKQEEFNKTKNDTINNTAKFSISLNDEKENKEKLKIEKDTIKSSNSDNKSSTNNSHKINITLNPKFFDSDYFNSQLEFPISDKQVKLEIYKEIEKLYKTYINRISNLNKIIQNIFNEFKEFHRSIINNNKNSFILFKVL